MQKPKVAMKKPYTEKLAAGTYYWCQCGLSLKQPFCDGHHDRTSFSPKKFEVKTDKYMSLCQCKQTNYPPDCDGSHRKIDG
ncbi:MAG: CDGSH iron-sulfur domain-containing protein [Leptospirales bacterium]